MTRAALSLAVVLAGAAHARAADLTVGFGETDITPAVGKQPVFLAGFGQNRKATSVHDPLFARALVLADGEVKVALVSVDVVGLFLPFVESVREKLPGFKYVLVSATHNHEGPDTLGLWGPNPLSSGVDREGRKWNHPMNAPELRSMAAQKPNRPPCFTRKASMRPRPGEGS